MKPISRSVFSLAILTVWMSHISCDQINDANAIKGNREYSTVDRSLDVYSEVEIHGDFDIELNPAFNNKVSIYADSNLHNYIYTEVNNGRLVISPPENRSLRSLRDIKIVVGAKSLKSMVINGSNHLSSTAVLVFDTLHFEMAGASQASLELSGGNFNGEFPGAVSLELKGFVKSLDVDISGAAKLSAFDLQAAKCQISLAGAAKADVFVTDTLDVNIAGVGLVNYKGEPRKVYSSIGGIGKLQQVD